MNLRIIRVFMFGLIMSALWFSLLAPAQPQRAVQEDEIREAIVRYQIEKWDLHAEVYFIEIQSKDPNKAFLQRFADIVKPVKAKSESRKKKDYISFYIEDRRTKKIGVVFYQGEINWKTGSAVEVEGGYSCASQCMAAGIYYLIKQDGRWSVTKFKIRIQS
jgi:hypothetical protein